MLDDNENPVPVENVPNSAAEGNATNADDLQLACDPALSEDLALALLKRADLAAAVLERLAKNSNALKSRKVKMGLASHPHTPRHISIPLVRQFYTFDLVRVSLSSTAPPDVKIVAEDVLIARLKTITLGERISLARRSSGRIAAGLLLDPEARVIQTALENGRLTEALVVRAVLRPQAGAALIHAVARHAKWSLRREVRIALLRTEFLPAGRALEFSRGIPLALLREVLSNSRLPSHVKEQILEAAEV